MAARLEARAMSGRSGLETMMPRGAWALFQALEDRVLGDGGGEQSLMQAHRQGAYQGQASTLGGAWWQQQST